MDCISRFKRPILPPLRAHEQCISALKLWAAKTQHRNSIPSRASAFWNIQGHGLTDDLLEVVDVIRDYTVAISHLLQDKPGSIPIVQLTMTRVAIEKNLLQLPSGTELPFTNVAAPNIYECCRLTTMIYTLAVVLPIPDPYDILQIYVTHLKNAIEESNLYQFGLTDRNLFSMLLWILMLGGIAASDKPERRWFVSQLALLVDQSNLDWQGVEEDLESFLWFDYACGPGGRKLWAKIEDLAS
jgi:hypothetical protein